MGIRRLSAESDIRQELHNLRCDAVEAGLEMDQFVGIVRDEMSALENCKHLSYSQDNTTGECNCDDCGKLLIDCIGRVIA